MGADDWRFNSHAPQMGLDILSVQYTHPQQISVSSGPYACGFFEIRFWTCPLNWLLEVGELCEERRGLAFVLDEKHLFREQIVDGIFQSGATWDTRSYWVILSGV